MSIASHLDKILAEFNPSQAVTPDICRQMLSVMDLTLLDKNSSSNDLNELSAKALKYEVAALCVYPEQLPQSWPDSSGTRKATVVNFPGGDEPLAQNFAEIDKALSLNVEEIDYVFAYKAYLNGKQSDALNNCQQVIDYCNAHGLTTKIILETGAYGSIELIYQVSKEIVSLGCNFLKTSTGKIAQGASLSAAFAMLSAIIDTQSNCGIKLSGGIKTPEQAMQYINLAEKMIGRKAERSWFRIGASSLLNHLIK